MPLERMEHFLVNSEDIDRTKDFYCEVLGMKEGFRPKLSFAGYWLYLGDIPCIHIADWEGYQVFTKEMDIPISTLADGTGPLDHIAFNASDYDGMVAKLKALGLSFKHNELDEIGLRQIFVRDPNGLCIELNFRS
jgi:catechol 2,3-dioxygenase-like lactoylglutathione lyase family enzyme